jgi:acyl-homoserine-lactone acylase
MLFADTYIHFVKFNRQGAERIETLLPFEQTRTCEQYEDELAMFNRREMKTMSLDKAEILKKAKRIYNPIRRAATE